MKFSFPAVFQVSSLINVWRIWRKVELNAIMRDYSAVLEKGRPELLKVPAKRNGQKLVIWVTVVAEY